MDYFFKIKERGSSTKTELLAGFSTFAAMSYILAVNPSILMSTGMDKAGLISVTALMACISTLAMGLFTNRPIALASAMGTNAYFAFFVCATMGLKWNEALSLVFYNGVIFVIISILGIREKVIEAIPNSIKVGLQCGIGLFIAYMGLNHADIIVKDNTTLTTIGNIGLCKPLLAIIGFVIIAILSIRKHSFAIIFSIAIITIAAFFLKDANGNPIATKPTEIFSIPNSISQTFFALDFAYPFKNFTQTFPIILTLLALDFFDTLGTVIALGRRAGFFKDGKVPEMKKILLVDSSATVLGALMGTSTVSCYVESATGIESGGKTGLTSVVVSVCFLLALFLSPLIFAVPSIATAPALIWVGLMMLTGLTYLDFKDLSEYLPTFVCMIVIMLSFSITEGFAFAIVLYAILKLFSHDRKNIPISTWILSLLMLLFLIYK